jgi:LemA protein
MKTPKTGMYVLIGVVALVVILLLWAVGSYNGLVGSDEQVKEKWGNVETQYQRRADLIPNLVATVKEYTDYEGPLLTEITQARSQWQNAGTVEERQEAAGAMDSALSRLLVVVENYPTLQASPQFVQLQDQLEGTENRIQYARQEYNGAVRDYNIRTRRFPTAIIAGMFGFDQREPFEATEGSENAPSVGELFD